MAENGKLNFDKVWQALMETRELIEFNSKETERILKESKLETDRKFQESDKRLQETERIIKESSLEVDRQIKELKKQIGNMHQERGTYTEVILMNSIENLITKQFKLNNFFADFNRQIGEDRIQLDAVGFTNSSRNEALIVEVKTQLRIDDLEQLEKNLKKVNKFIPEIENKKKYGMIIALKAKPENIRKVLDAGFYFATVKDDLVVMKTDKNFKPKAY